MSDALEGKFRIEGNALGALTRIFYNDEPFLNATLVRYEASADGMTELTLCIVPIGGVEIEGDLTAKIVECQPGLTRCNCPERHTDRWKCPAYIRQDIPA